MAKKPDIPKLGPIERRTYEMLEKGYRYDAAPHCWRGCSQDLRAMQRLVKKGLAKLSKPTYWAKHGIYVLNEEYD